MKASEMIVGMKYRVNVNTLFNNTRLIAGDVLRVRIVDKEDIMVSINTNRALYPTTMKDLASLEDKRIIQIA